MTIDQQHIKDLPPPIERFKVPTENWKNELHKKLLQEKIHQIQVDKRMEKEEIIRNYDILKNEAENLLEEIKQFDPNDRWQYKKGLRLMYLGTKLGIENYKNEGHKFFNLKWENNLES